MKICVIQPRPLRGDIAGNITNHLKLIHLALVNGADTIIFPELSLTGYEPELAGEVAIEADDTRLHVFQEISNMQDVIIGVGAPTRTDVGTCITLILFQPHQEQQTYIKKHLHADEEPFFVSGTGSVGLIGKENSAALAICYEISVPEHAQTAAQSGAAIYIASVAKSVTGIDKALTRLAQIASEYAMTVLMANCIGMSGDGECAGKSAVWDSRGLLLAQLNDTNEGLLILDTTTQDIIRILV